MHAVELLVQAAPGLIGAGLHDADQQQGQLAQLDMGADAVLAVVEDRPQGQGVLRVPAAAFHLDELLVGGGQVVAAGQALGGGRAETSAAGRQDSQLPGGQESEPD